MLSLAAGAMEELSKDSPSGEVLEYKTKDFVKTVEVGQWRTIMVMLMVMLRGSLVIKSLAPVITVLACILAP